MVLLETLDQRGLRLVLMIFFSSYQRDIQQARKVDF